MIKRLAMVKTGMQHGQRYRNTGHLCTQKTSNGQKHADTENRQKTWAESETQEESKGENKARQDEDNHSNARQNTDNLTKKWL